MSRNSADIFSSLAEKCQACTHLPVSALLLMRQGMGNGFQKEKNKKTARKGVKVRNKKHLTSPAARGMEINTKRFFYVDAKY